MLPVALLDVQVERGVALPRYLTRRDETWLRLLQDAVVACVGAPLAHAERRIANVRLPGASWRQRQAAGRLLLRLHELRLRAPCDPGRVREVVFDLAAASRAEGRAHVIAEAARRLGLDDATVEATLYADLPGERVLAPATVVVSPAELVQRYNLELLQGLLFFAEELSVRVTGGVRQAVRFARLQRLLVEVLDEEGEPGAVSLRISGPLSLLRSTTKYGHAMARWVPALTRLAPWRLEARCRLGGETVAVRASHADPVGTTHALPRRFDSGLEERFFRDLARLGTSWEILREASPVQLDGRIACPDFTLVDESRGLAIPVEIVGFWTPEYVRSKLDLIHRLPGRARWMLCVDADLGVGEGPDGWGADAFLFRRRLDAAAFLAWLEARVASDALAGPVPVMARS